VPHLRIGGGVLVGRLNLHGASGDSSSTAVGGAGYALLGVTVLLPTRWLGRVGARGVTAGLVVEGGGTMTSPLGFRLAPTPSEEARIATTGTDLGAFPMHAGLLRIGAVIRF
jgi:hypothetical protein